MKDSSAQLIKAAGGVLCLTDGAGPRFAVVHKSKYDTWGLPKGKFKFRVQAAACGGYTDVSGYSNIVFSR